MAFVSTSAVGTSKRAQEGPMAVGAAGSDMGTLTIPRISSNLESLAKLAITINDHILSPY